MRETSVNPDTPIEKPSSADGASGAESSGVDPGVSRRRLVEIRCGFAELARQEADAAEARVAEARHACDEQLAEVVAAQAALDSGGSHEAKEAAHRAFRNAVNGARAHSQVEAAANAWLTDINRANGVLRAAQQRVRREREVAVQLRAQLDGVIATAEANRTMADAAVEACRTSEAELAAMEAGPAPEVAVAIGAVIMTASADAEPAQSRGASAPPSVPPVAVASAAATMAGAASVLLPPGERPESPPDELTVDLHGRHVQAVIRLLRRDKAALTMLVDRLATDATGRSFWQFLLSNFVDAVAAAAMDEGFFDFPEGNLFWDLFTREQAREVARGLAALGFRYDGMGGFVDGRVPDQRDLALAIGQAGLNPGRIRFWPHPSEAAELFRQARVATDLYIAEKAPSLTLGELVRLLGRRAEMLTDLWNDWPRVRPLLFTTSGG